MTAPERMTPLASGVENGVRWVTCVAPIYGAVNGYVLLPEGHPWRGLDYDQIDVEVHGGLTYGHDGWIGFDTLHAGDVWPGSPQYGGPRPYDMRWTAEMVAEEARRLAARVAAAAETTDTGPVSGPPYPPDRVPDDHDDGTMPTNVAEFAEQVVGRRIIKAEKTDFRPEDFDGTEHTYWSSYSDTHGLVLTLDDGRRVVLVDTSDCCAYTSLEEFFLHPERVDHVITGVATTDGYERWHVFADLGDILELKIGWSAGNPFYYGYGFNIGVSNVIEGSLAQPELEQGQS
ncbi:hypothetical protein SEA_SUERTE_42 [Gordonia phage Suerte]|uniref:DUF7448 domain-containing protein n=1 Tax=Gordonia phage Suerte TaxID=2652883 RepID=A0A5P8DDD3_9CAUD|nr:hypothetical protein PP511_gp42 [Gordonia phage Suerte]QFP97013.1 hypothetical protein SEA_SUERTE_42 [Gordonia phage Suerte]